MTGLSAVVAFPLLHFASLLHVQLPLPLRPLQSGPGVLALHKTFLLLEIDFYKITSRFPLTSDTPAGSGWFNISPALTSVTCH